MILKLKYVFFEHVAIENAYSVNNNKCTITFAITFAIAITIALLHFMPCI